VSVVSGSPEPALLTSSNGESHAVWQGVRITAVSDLSQSQELRAGSSQERLRQAMAEDVNYLHSQLVPGQGSCLELRFVSDPVARRIDAAVLGLVVLPTSPAAVEAARGQAVRLAQMPANLTAEPILDAGEVHRLLQPFVPHPAGSVELRKRHLIGAPQRPDARVLYYFAVQPLAPRPNWWGQVFDALLALPQPVAISIGLVPVWVSEAFSASLDRVATEFARLSQPANAVLGPLTGAQVQLTPDTFAVHAHLLFADAARRYRHAAFRFRVSLASPAPLGDGVAHLVGALVAPGAEFDSTTYLDRQAVGNGYVVVRPRQEDEVAQFRRNFATLEHGRWGLRELWQARDRPPAMMRDLTELVDPTEASAAFRLPAAPAGHLPGFVVRHPGVHSEVRWVDDGSSIDLGQQVIGSSAAGGRVGVSLAELTRHVLLAGTTGSGKTNTALHLVEQLWRRHRVPVLVIEPVNSALDDYRWLATLDGFDDLVVLTVGNERVAPLRLNPFQVPRRVTVGAHASGLLSCFDAAFGLWDPLPSIYQRALRLTYASKEWAAHDVAEGSPSEDWPTLDDFVAAMRTVTDGLDYAGETRSNILAASRLRAESMREGMCASTLACRASYPVESLLSRPVVVELALVADNQKEQALVTALLLQVMTEHYKATRPGGGLRHVTVVEEAHRLLGKPPAATGTNEGDARGRAAEAFANTLAENRKYGEGLVVVEQDPSKLITDAVKNTGCKIMHRLPGQDDRDVLGAAMGLSADQASYAGRLEPMTSLVHHDGLTHAALVRVPDVRARAATALGVKRAPLAADGDLRERFVRFAAHEPQVDAAVAPYAECAGCRSRCLFRSRSETIAAGMLAGSVRDAVRVYSPQADPRAKAQWWAGLHASVARAVAGHGRRRPSEGLKDQEACAFMHVMRALYENDFGPWVDRFRTTMTTTPPEAVSGTAAPPALDGPA